jgi:hypothetical protein
MARHWGVQMSPRLMLVQPLWRHNEIRTHPDWRISSGLHHSLRQQSHWPHKKLAWPAIQLTKNWLGPSYQDVAKKYAGQKDAVAVLTKAIKTGGSGKYGPVPMPPQAALSEADAKTLATWVMAGAK